VLYFNGKKMSDKNTSFESTDKDKMESNLSAFNFSSPLIMGILNITPDSFFDGGEYNSEETWLNRVVKMVDEGVDIIDVGGMSTRPGAKFISQEEELKRVLPPLRMIKKKFPEVPVSVDTFRSEVATACVQEGANLINDISGGTYDANMFKTIAHLGVPYVLMHIAGTPETMQQNPIDHGIVEKVRNFFEDRVNRLFDIGVSDIILDPGFGFGKSLECNYSLLKNMEQICIYGLPFLAGISRKSMINKVLGVKPAGALNGTTALNMLALQHGAKILRVHDVKEAKEVVKLYEFYKQVEC